MKKSSLGISLISLIITIIVIIILAAIVIFSGLGTADDALFARFTSEFSDFNLAVDNAYMEEFTDNALTNMTRSKKQIYYKMATGRDVVKENGDDINIIPEPTGKVADLPQMYPEGLEGEDFYLITDDRNIKGWERNKNYFEETETHYVTDEGEAFFLPGYLVEGEDGNNKWYVNEKKYYVAEQGLREPSGNGGTENPGEGGETPGENPEEGITYTITFNGNGGTGSMSSATVNVEAGETTGTYTLPVNGFTAPSGQEFSGWEVDGVVMSAGSVITVSNDTILKALWATKETLADKLEIGDYVEYTPVTASSQYVTNPAGRKDLYTGYSSQTLTQATGLTWRVIKVDESTGEVLITPTDAVNTGTYLKGAPGYLNHKNVLDDICKTLYSNTELGVTARSMKLEDLDYTVSDSTTRYAYYPSNTPTDQLVDKEYNGVTYTAKAHTSSKNSPYNDWTFWEYDHVYSGEQKATYTETVTIGDETYNYTYEYAKPIEVEENGSTTYYPVLVSYKRGSATGGNSTARACIGSTYGWLASSYVRPSTSYAYFHVRNVYSSGHYNFRLAFSHGDAASGSGGVRPVVSLGSTLKVDISDATRDGNEPETAWKIIKK